jgi:uncharacterized beta-barrel protein YwiB (DUF1934 family)
MTTKEVANGYGVTEYAIRQNKVSLDSELIAGKHFVMAVRIPHGELPSALKTAHNAVLWTKRGVVRLGFAMRSDRARLFRDWAEELVINKLESKHTEQLTTFGQLSERLEKKYNRYPEFKEMWDIIESAIIACGSAVQLSNRLGINDSIFSLIKKRPWLVSEEKQKAILIGCRNILSRNAKIDTETIEQLMMIDDHDLRMNLYTKMRKGGLL